VLALSAFIVTASRPLHVLLSIVAELHRRSTAPQGYGDRAPEHHYLGYPIYLVCW